jgi:hypothetical protein
MGQLAHYEATPEVQRLVRTGIGETRLSPQFFQSLLPGILCGETELQAALLEFAAALRSNHHG